MYIIIVKNEKGVLPPENWENRIYKQVFDNKFYKAVEFIIK